MWFYVICHIMFCSYCNYQWFYDTILLTTYNSIVKHEAQESELAWQTSSQDSGQLWKM